MLGGIDPSKMKAMMKQMGIKQEQIDAGKVIIEKNEGRRIIIENPNVIKMTMQGQDSWQITGDAREEEETGFNEEDVQMIMDKTGKSKAQVLEVLDETGDIAETIVRLS